MADATVPERESSYSSGLSGDFKNVEEGQEGSGYGTVIKCKVQPVPLNLEMSGCRRCGSPPLDKAKKGVIQMTYKLDAKSLAETGGPGFTRGCKNCIDPKFKNYCWLRKQEEEEEEEEEEEAPQKHSNAEEGKENGVKSSRRGFPKEHLATEYDKECVGFYPQKIKEKDRVEFLLDGDSLGFADRNKLLKLSESYQYCVENEWNDCLTALNFRTEENTNRMTIIQYLKYIVDESGRKVSVLKKGKGSFMDMCQFIGFANKMGTPKLEELCANKMCRRAKIEEAAFVVKALQPHFHLVDKKIMNRFRNFVRKNVDEFMEDSLSASIIREDEELFGSFLYNPVARFWIEGEDDDNLKAAKLKAAKRKAAKRKRIVYIRRRQPKK